mgnify:FL=1
MTDLILKGIVTGFILSIMIGPVFFVLLETSIRRGIRAALALDLGVLISDAFYILIAYVFYAEVSSLTAGKNQMILKLVGGILFLAYALFTWFKKPKEMKVDEVGRAITTAGDYVKLALKGFFLNIANPLVIFYWFSVMTLAAKSNVNGDPQHSSVLFLLSVILITFFSIDILKILGAKKLRPLVTDKLLIALNHLIAIVFAIFGVVLVVQSFTEM